jgi:hypothetical protein
LRRRLNKPRIVEIEKIVEKVVEKIVEVEIPVQKIVTTEIPVEIVRKEIVYVPFYSSESGLVDISEGLKGTKPNLNESSSSFDNSGTTKVEDSEGQRKETSEIVSTNISQSKEKPG